MRYNGLEREKIMNEKKLRKGQQFSIHCYKHDGSLHRTWDEATVLFENDEMLICGNNKTIVTENDGHSHRTNEPAILFFYKKHWFNVIGQLKPYGLFYYCNIASPYLIDGNIIKYIDYDLDLRVFPDGGYRILDNNEYNYHRRLMHYPTAIDNIIRKELSYLIELKKNMLGPFAKGEVLYYHQIYEEVKNSCDY